MIQIIGLQGKGNSGKTTTIKMLPRVLKSYLWKPIIGLYQQINEADFLDVYEKDNFKLGVTSIGDTHRDVSSALQTLSDAGCNIIVCACRTFDRSENGTLAAVYKYSEEPIFINKQRTENKIEAEELALNEEDVQIILTTILKIMEYKIIEVDEYKVVIIRHNDKSPLLLEAIHVGQPLVGNYSVKKHQPHIPSGDYHLHVYDGENQIFAINKNGTPRDGYGGVRIPNKVYKAIKKQYPTWKLPPDKILEAIHFTYILQPIDSMRYRELINELYTLQAELNSFEQFNILNESENFITDEHLLSSIEENREAIKKRHIDLFVESVKRLD